MICWNINKVGKFNIFTEIYAILAKVITKVFYQTLAFEHEPEWSIDKCELLCLLLF